MLRALRNHTGEPRVAVRVLAALVVAGMVALAAPLAAAVVLPAVRWVLGVL